MFNRLSNPAVRDDESLTKSTQAGQGPLGFTNNSNEIRFNSSNISSPRNVNREESNDDRDERVRILSSLDSLRRKQGCPNLEYSNSDDLLKLKRTEMAMRRVTGARQAVLLMKRGMCFLASALEWVSSKGFFNDFIDLEGFSQHINATKDSYTQQLSDVYEYMGAFTDVNPVAMLCVSFTSNMVYYGFSRAMINKKLRKNSILEAENDRLRKEVATTTPQDEDPLLKKKIKKPSLQSIFEGKTENNAVGAVDLQSLYQQEPIIFGAKPAATEKKTPSDLLKMFSEKNKTIEEESKSVYSVATTLTTANKTAAAAEVVTKRDLDIKHTPQDQPLTKKVKLKF